jgi:hypothetical protein
MNNISRFFSYIYDDKNETFYSDTENFKVCKYCDYKNSFQRPHLYDKDMRKMDADKLELYCKEWKSDFLKNLEKL